VSIPLDQYWRVKIDIPNSMKGTDGDGDDEGSSEETPVSASRRMYIHPMMKPARPKRGGTHQVVVSAG